MVIVTARAKEALAQMRASANVNDPEMGLRLEAGSTGGMFGLFPDREKPGDHIVEHDGTKVLLIADGLADALTGAKIDAKLAGASPQLVIGRADPGSAPEDNGQVT